MHVLKLFLYAFALSLTPLQVQAVEGPPIFSRYGVCSQVKNYEAVRGAGYDYIEGSVRGLLKPDSSDAEVAEDFTKLKEGKVQILACNSFLPKELKCLGPEADHEAILKYSEVAFRRAKELGVKGIVFGSAGARRLPEGMTREEGVKQFVELLKKMAPLAQAEGVQIWLEPLNTEEDNFLNTLVQGKEIVAAVGHSSVGMVCDLYHLLRNGESPENIIVAGSYIRHCHIAEKEKRTAPGMKGDDFTPYFEALAKIGYSGSISMECGWDDFETRLPLALAYVKRQAGGGSTTHDGILTYDNLPLGTLTNPLVMRTFMPFGGLDPSVLANHHKGDKSPKYNPQIGKDVPGEYLPISGLPAAFGVNYGRRLSYCWDTVECRLLYAWSGGFLDMQNYWGDPKLGNRQSFGYVPELRGEMFYRATGGNPVVVNGKAVQHPKYLGYSTKGGVLEFAYKEGNTEIRQSIKPGKEANTFESRISLVGEGKLSYMPLPGETLNVVSEKEIIVSFSGLTIAKFEAPKKDEFLKGKPTVKMGEAVFAKMACITCHSLDGSQSHGPTLLGLYGSERPIQGMKEKLVVDDAYIRESINNPNAKVVEGFPANYMPAFNLQKKEVEALLLYIKSLEKE